MKTIWVVLISIAAGALLCFGLVSLHSNKQIEKLKQYGDSVAVVAHERDSVANQMNDSVKVVVAELEQTKRALVTATTVNRRIDRQLDSALVLATTAADSNNIRGQQVVNLRQETVSLRGALAIANAQRDVETRRADKNLADLNEANAQIIKLNNRVQNLGPTIPGWVRTGLEVIAISGAFYAGTQVGKNSN